MTTTEATTELSTMLSDTLQQVSTDRLSQAIASAWNDSYVCVPVINDTLTYDSTVSEYTLPSGITQVGNISVLVNGYPEDVSADLYEVVDKTIRFNSNANNYLYTGLTLSLRGYNKLTTSDEIPDSNFELREYVVNLAAWIILKQLGFSKAVAFLNNDTSMNELIGFRREVERDVKYLRTQLGTSYQDN